LVEQAAANRVLYSSDWGESAWSRSGGVNGVSVSTSSAIREKSLIADGVPHFIEPNGSTSDHIRQTVGTFTGDAEVAYVKVERHFSNIFSFGVRNIDAATWIGIFEFDFQNRNLALKNTQDSSEVYARARVEAEAGPSNGGEVVHLQIMYSGDHSENVGANSRQIRFWPDTGAGDNPIIAHHAQVQNEGVATSPIRTRGSSVTRDNEVFELNPGSQPDWWNTTQGSILAHVSLRNYGGVGATSWNNNDFEPDIFVDTDGSRFNLLQARIKSRGNNNFRLSDGSVSISLGTPHPYGLDKVAFSYSKGRLRFSVNGNSIEETGAATDGWRAAKNIELAGLDRGAAEYDILSYFANELSLKQLDILTQNNV
jgi:hypothetical protein